MVRHLDRRVTEVKRGMEGEPTLFPQPEAGQDAVSRARHGAKASERIPAPPSPPASSLGDGQPWADAIRLGRILEDICRAANVAKDDAAPLARAVAHAVAFWLCGDTCGSRIVRDHAGDALALRRKLRQPSKCGAKPGEDPDFDLIFGEVASYYPKHPDARLVMLRLAMLAADAGRGDSLPWNVDECPMGHSKDIQDIGGKGVDTYSQPAKIDGGFAQVERSQPVHAKGFTDDSCLAQTFCEESGRLHLHIAAPVTPGTAVVITVKEVDA